MSNKIKRCNSCGLTYPLSLENWYKNNNSQDGFFSTCKICMYDDLKKKTQQNKKINEEKLSLGKLENPTEKKICSKCKAFKPLTFEFWNKVISSKDGFTSRCKECDKERFKNYYNRELENIKQRHKNIPSYVLRHVKNMAQKRKLIFDIELEYYKNNLFKKECHYCGGETKGWLDRVNNNIGYTVNNVVSSCENCNRAKGIMSSEEFFQHIFKILKYNKIII